MQETLQARVVWTVNERDPHTGLYLPRLARKNTLTNDGLTQLAANWVGAGNLPLFLVIESFKGLLQASYAAGATAIQTDVVVDQAGDTQLVLGVGSANQETVTFASRTGTGPYTYNLSTPTTKSHSLNDWATRAVAATDTMSKVASEVQYDGVSFPNQRMKASGAGYSSGTANWVLQFFLTGSQAITDWVTLGLSENSLVGAGALHNHVSFGYTHPSGTDVVLQASLTVANG